MTRYRRIALGVAVFGAVFLAAQPRAGALTLDFFTAEVEAGSVVGFGTGYVDPTLGQWIQYDPQNTPADPSDDWWNQWFFSGPLDLDGKQDLVLFMVVTPTTDAPWELAFTLNWSTPDWQMGPPTAGGRPPLPNEEAFIVRSSTHTIGGTSAADLSTVDIGTPDPNGYFSDTVLLPLSIDSYLLVSLLSISDFEPEWVSVDVRGFNAVIAQGILAQGPLVPEPATMALLGLGMAAIGLRGLRGTKRSM